MGSLFKPAIEVFRGLEGGSGINIFLFLALVGFHCPEHPKEIKKAFEEIVRWHIRLSARRERRSDD